MMSDTSVLTSHSVDVGCTNSVGGGLGWQRRTDYVHGSLHLDDGHRLTTPRPVNGLSSLRLSLKILLRANKSPTGNCSNPCGACSVGKCWATSSWWCSA